MNTLKAGSSNWMTSTPSFSSAARLLVQQVGEGQRHLHLVAVVAVGDGVGDRHGTGQGELELSLRVCAGEPRLHRVHAAPEAHRPHHLRHHRLIAVGADAHLHLVGEVDALDPLQEAVHEMLARLLAVADDVDAGILLLLDGKQRGVALGLHRARRPRAATAPTACWARPARPASAGCRRWWSRTWRSSRAGLPVRLPAMLAAIIAERAALRKSWAICPTPRPRPTEAPMFSAAEAARFLDEAHRARARYQNLPEAHRAQELR